MRQRPTSQTSPTSPNKQEFLAHDAPPAVGPPGPKCSDSETVARFRAFLREAGRPGEGTPIEVLRAHKDFLELTDEQIARFEHEQEVLLALARGICIGAHHGQLDKAGLPYRLHPIRVEQLLCLQGARASTHERVVALLHDVFEDSNLGRRDLLDAGIPIGCIKAIVAITRQKGEDADNYYARVKRNPIALKVKKADIADNMNPDRLALLDDATRERLIRKYTHALKVLNAQ